MIGVEFMNYSVPKDSMKKALKIKNFQGF